MRTTITLDYLDERDIPDLLKLLARDYAAALAERPWSADRIAGQQHYASIGIVTVSNQVEDPTC